MNVSSSFFQWKNVLTIIPAVLQQFEINYDKREYILKLWKESFYLS